MHDSAFAIGKIAVVSLIIYNTMYSSASSVICRLVTVDEALRNRKLVKSFVLLIWDTKNKELCDQVWGTFAVIPADVSTGPKVVCCLLR